MKDLFFTARLVEAQEALSLGLLTEVVADHAALMRRARELATTMAGFAPLTLRATKEALRRIGAAQSLPPDADLVGLCYGSEDFREGIARFWRSVRRDGGDGEGDSPRPCGEKLGDVLVRFADSDLATVNSPFALSGEAKVAPRMAPKLGEHTDDVLREIAFDAGAIARMRENKAVV